MHKQIVDDFHKLFYDKRIFKKCKWLGIDIWKNPLDLWIYQEILFDNKPDLIIETGTYKGASAHFLASMINLVGYNGKVISIDVTSKNFPKLDNLEFITDNSISEAVLEKIRNESKNKKVMVILDSDHSKNHVLQELKLYSPIVSSGQYLIIEDTNLNGYPVYSKGFNGSNPGPMEAVNEFMKENNDFIVDESKHKFLLTMHPYGFLLKK